MPTFIYNSSWNDILVDLISAGYASPGDSISDVEANANFQAVNGNFGYDGGECLCPPCCTFSDIKNYAGQIMQPVYSSASNWSTNYNAFLTFQQNMWTHYQNTGCSWWANRVTLWTSQLLSITNPYQLALKTAKIQFAQQMHTACCCPGPVPTFAPPTPAAKEISTTKIISSFDLDLKDIKAAGETRKFTISGTKDSVFSLEITNEDSKYYNFRTNLFQVAKTKLDNVSIEGGIYSGKIIFPVVTDADQYDFTLTAEQKTSHNGYLEARFDDGSIDINSSTGSNSNILKKVIYQTLDTTITLSSYSGGSLITSITNVEQTIAASRVTTKGVKR